MKNNNLLLKTSTILLSTSLLFACGGGSSDSVNAPTSAAPDVEVSELSTAEKEGLLFMREEEELARDLYLDIYAAKGNRLNTFKNISDNAETQHAEAMRVLLEKYGLEDPSTGEHNTYTSPELQALYDQLLNIALGSDDLAALRVGALVEESDIEDIQNEILQVSEEHEDIISTYENLLCGSRNHLRAFASRIENITGEDYQTQLPVMADEVDEILNSSQEQCSE